MTKIIWKTKLFSLTHCIVLVVGKCRFWLIDLGNFQNLDNFFVLNLAEKSKNKNNKNFKKYKNKKFFFFRPKLEQEIKIRKNPEKSGNPKKSSQKIYHFLIDFRSLTPVGVPFPLE